MKKNEDLSKKFIEILHALAEKNDANFLFTCVDNKKNSLSEKWNYVYQIDYETIDNKYKTLKSAKSFSSFVYFNDLANLNDFLNAKKESIKTYLELSYINEIKRVQIVCKFKKLSDLLNNDDYLKLSLLNYLNNSILNEDNLFFKFSNLMLFANDFYKHNDIFFWWISSLRDIPFGLFIFNLKTKHSYWLFVFIALFYVKTYFSNELKNKNKKRVNINYLNQIDKILNEKGNVANNKSTSLKEEFNKSLKINPLRLIDNLNFILNVYDLIEEGYYNNFLMISGKTYSNRFEFSKEFLLKCYFDLLFNYDGYLYSKEDKLKKELESLKDEDKRIVRKIFKNQYPNNTFNTNFKTGFDKYILNNTHKEHEITEDNDLGKLLHDFTFFHDDEEKNKDVLKVETEGNSDYKERIDEFLNNFNSFADKDIDLTNSIIYSNPLFYNKNCREMYLASTNEFLERIVSLHLSMFLNGGKFNAIKEESINEKDLLNKGLISYNYPFFVKYLKENKDDFKYIDKFYLDEKFFAKENSIKFNLEIININNLERPLKEDEIENEIKEKYKEINGYFRYSENSDPLHYELLTRSELINRLKEEIICLDFKYKIKFKNIGKEDILLVK